MYVAICDLHGHRRSQVMVRNERLYMASWISLVFSWSLKKWRSYSSFPKNNVYDVRWPEVHRSSAEMAPCCSHAVGHYFSLYMKSLAPKLAKKLCFHNIHDCDHLWTSRSLHGAKWKTIYEFLSMNNCNYSQSGTVTGM